MATMIGSKKASYIVAACAMTASTATVAQTVNTPIPVLPSDYPTERVSVADRFRPEYQSDGIRMGLFSVRPSLSAGGGYISNVYGSENSAADDVYALINPSVSIEANPEGQGGATVVGQIDAMLRRYAQQDRANESAFGGQLSGTLPLGGETSLSAGTSLRRRYERQDSGSFPAAAIAPIRYDDYTGFVRFRTGGSRIRVIAGADVSRDNFSNARLADGTSFDQSYRNRTVIRGSGRVEASFTGAAAAFVEGRYSDINYERFFLSPTVRNRDGNQKEVLAGLRIDSGKLRGVVSAGYSRRDFDANIYRNFGGLAVNGELTYYASGITTYTLNVYRNIAESGDPSVSAQFGTGAALRVDHELLRYIILSGRAGYDSFSYRGQDRKDNVASVGGGIRYLMNRHFEISLDADYVKRTSSGAASVFAPEFNRFQGGLNLIAKL